jgi:hypothetical protein
LNPLELERGARITEMQHHRPGAPGRNPRVSEQLREPDGLVLDAVGHAQRAAVEGALDLATTRVDAGVEGAHGHDFGPDAVVDPVRPPRFAEVVGTWIGDPAVEFEGGRDPVGELVLFVDARVPPGPVGEGVDETRSDDSARAVDHFGDRCRREVVEHDAAVGVDADVAVLEAAPCEHPTAAEAPGESGWTATRERSADRKAQRAGAQGAQDAASGGRSGHGRGQYRVTTLERE